MNFVKVVVLLSGISSIGYGNTKEKVAEFRLSGLYNEIEFDDDSHAYDETHFTFDGQYLFILGHFQVGPTFYHTSEMYKAADVHKWKRGIGIDLKYNILDIQTDPIVPYAFASLITHYSEGQSGSSSNSLEVGIGCNFFINDFVSISPKISGKIGGESSVKKELSWGLSIFI